MTTDRQEFEAALAEGADAIRQAVDQFRRTQLDAGVDPETVEEGAARLRAKLARKVAELAALAEPPAGSA